MRAQEPDDETIARVARALYEDSVARFPESFSAPWAEVHSYRVSVYRQRAQELLAGIKPPTAHSGVDVILREIQIQEIPEALALLVERYTRVMGSVPDFPQ